MPYVDSFKKFSGKSTKKVEEQENAEVLNVPEQFKAENDAINKFKDDIAKAEQKLAADKAKLNGMVKELQNKVAAEQTKSAAQQQNQQNQPAQAATSGTVEGSVKPQA